MLFFYIFTSPVTLTAPNRQLCKTIKITKTALIILATIFYQRSYAAYHLFSNSVLITGALYAAFAAGYGRSNHWQFCPCTAALSGYRAVWLSVLLATRVKWNYHYFSGAIRLACYTGNRDGILQLRYEANYFLLLAKAQKSALLFPQSLFKPSAMSLENLLCYFSGYFNTVHNQLSSSSH